MNALRPLRLLLLLLAVSLASCAVFLDTEALPPLENEDVDDTSDPSPDEPDDPSTEDTDARDVAPDAGDADVGDTGTDADTGPDADIGGDTTQPGLNACGGTGELRHAGGAAQPGEACGQGGSGVLVCASPEHVQCVGEASLNACGGVGDLGSTLGEACGRCGDGKWACDGEGGLRCLGARPANACGGCGTLAGRPSASCEVEGEPGSFVCTTPETLACLTGGRNACGGTQALLFADDPALPGDACETPCGPGLLVCDGEDALQCEPDGGTPLPNACGGCQPLRAQPTQPCGLCGNGEWTCDGDEGVRCEGASAPNACGGCDTLEGAPGDACGNTGTLLCDGQTLSCSETPVDVERNACGGTESLADEPGSACGSCEDGLIVCTGSNRTDCVGASTRNACGSCGPLQGREGDACGTCGQGALACEEGALACTNDPGEAAFNACGTCGELPVTLGDMCGSCLVWACGSAGGVRCVPTSELPGCGDGVTCSDLTCDEDNRRCIDTIGDEPARCGGCLDGYDEVDGTCALQTCDDLACDEEGRACTDGPPARCTTCLEGRVEEEEVCRDLLRCEDIGDTCDEAFRTCVEATASEDATCGPCEPGTVEEEDECRPRITCDDLTEACDAQRRTCIEPDPEDDARCGDCSSGHVDVDGACLPTACAALSCDALHRGCAEGSASSPAQCTDCLSGRAACPDLGDNACDVSTDTSAAHCGGCGISCDLTAGEVCTNGLCGCPEGTVLVDGVCEELEPEPPALSWLSPPDPSIHDLRADGFSVSAEVTAIGVPRATSVGACAALSPTIPDSDSSCTTVQGPVSAGRFTVDIDDLPEGEMHLVRAFVENEDERVWTDPIAIRTLTRPDIELTSVLPGLGDIRASFSVLDPGDPVATEFGVCVSESLSALEESCTTVDASPTSGPQGPFLIRDLPLGANLWVAAYATNATGRRLTAPTLVTTWALPRAEVLAVEPFSSSVLRVTVELQDRGEPQTVESAGACVGPNPSPRAGQAGVRCESIDAPLLGVSFEAIVQNLDPYTPYYVAAFARNEAGTHYASDTETRTNPLLPNVATVIDQVSATGFRVGAALEMPLPIPFPEAARAILEYAGAPEGGRIVELPTPIESGFVRAVVDDLPPDTSVIVRAEVFHPSYGWVGASSAFATTLGVWVLVSPDGTDSSTCGNTVAATPCATLEYAYRVRAPALARTEVRLLGDSSTTFELGDDPFALESGIDILGGYSITNGELIATSSRPTLRSEAEIAVLAVQLDAPTRLANVEIFAENQNAIGTSSIGLLVAQSEDHLELSSVDIVAGRPGPGANASTPERACGGMPGERGAQGTSSGNAAGGAPVCGFLETALCVGIEASPGRGITLPEANNCGGRGGTGSSGSGSGSAGFCSNEDGQGTQCLSARGGAGGSSSSCGSNTAATAPAGESGAMGNDGDPGHPGGSLPAIDVDTSGVWRVSPRTGGEGTPGSDGAAGGGGGGGGGSSQGLACSQTRRGGGGGSGGAGGQGGAPGLGGGGAGVSVALLVQDSDVRITGPRARWSTADGRQGGRGAAGGLGGEGGAGGTGGLRQEAQAGNGGDGGDGGDGGRGGCGGGGGGGSSIGMLGFGNASVLAENAPTLSVGLAGEGGEGGCAENAGDPGISTAMTGLRFCTSDAGCSDFPGQVQGLEAVATEEGIDLSWTATPWATGYRILLDDVEVGTVDASTTTFFDDTLGAPGIPLPPARMILIDAPPRQAGFRWSTVRPPAGPRGTYRVQALGDDAEGPPSQALATRRERLRPVEYQFLWPGGPTDLILTENTFTRTDPPLGSINIGTPTASTDLENGIQLSIPTASTSNGPIVTYEVRTLTDNPEDQLTGATFTGFMSAGTVSYQWQRATVSSGPFTLIAEGRTFLDTSVNPGQSFWYRVRVTSTGTEEILLSAPVQGTRAP